MEAIRLCRSLEGENDPISVALFHLLNAQNIHPNPLFLHPFLLMFPRIFPLFLLQILIFWSSIESGDACKITIKLKSNTKEKFRIQVFVPSVKQKSEKVLFTGPEEKKLQIEGEKCLERKWIVRTWKPDGEGGWVGAKQEQAFIDGNGWLRIVVNDDLRPQMTDRFSVFCSESPLCG